jgi:hypothetical protein
MSLGNATRIATTVSDTPKKALAVLMSEEYIACRVVGGSAARSTGVELTTDQSENASSIMRNVTIGIDQRLRSIHLRIFICVR